MNKILVIGAENAMRDVIAEQAARANVRVELIDGAAAPFGLIEIDGDYYCRKNPKDRGAETLLSMPYTKLNFTVNGFRPLNVSDEELIKEVNLINEKRSDMSARMRKVYLEIFVRRYQRVSGVGNVLMG